MQNKRLLKLFLALDIILAFAFFFGFLLFPNSLLKTKLAIDERKDVSEEGVSIEYTNIHNLVRDLELKSPILRLLGLSDLKQFWDIYITYDEPLVDYQTDEGPVAIKSSILYLNFSNSYPDKHLKSSFKETNREGYTHEMMLGTTERFTISGTESIYLNMYEEKKIDVDKTCVREEGDMHKTEKPLNVSIRRNVLDFLTIVLIIYISLIIFFSAIMTIYKSFDNQ